MEGQARALSPFSDFQPAKQNTARSELGIQIKIASVAHNLANLVKNSNGELGLEKLTESIWKLKPRKPNFIFSSFRPILTTNEILNLELRSCVTISVGPQTITLSEVHLLSQFETEKASVWFIRTSTMANSLQMALTDLLKSWKVQFSNTKQFFEELANFVTENELNFSLQPPAKGLQIRMMIGNVRMNCQLMAQRWKRPLVNVRAIVLTAGKVIWDGSVDALNSDNKSFWEVLGFLTTQRVESRADKMNFLQKKQMKLRKDNIKEKLLSVLSSDHTFTISKFSVGYWIVSRKEPLCLFEKLHSNMNFNPDKSFCLMPLESRLTISLVKTSEFFQCFVLTESHQIDLGTSRKLRCQWTTKGRMDEAVVSMTSEILDSWQSQFDLVDKFLTRLAHFLTVNKLFVRIKWPSELWLSQKIEVMSFSIENITTLTCLVIPPLKDRPLLKVELSCGKAFNTKDVLSFKHIFDYLTFLVAKSKSTPKRKGQDSQNNAKRIKPQDPESSQQQVPQPCSSLQSTVSTSSSMWSGSRPYLASQPLGVSGAKSLASVKLNQIKSILTRPLEYFIDINADRLELEGKLKIWQQSGYDVTMESADPDWWTVQAFNGQNQLNLDFAEIKGIEVHFTLRLRIIDDQDEVKGSSTNFYQSLIATLELFFEQIQEEFIKVEVEVEDEVT